MNVSRAVEKKEYVSTTVSTVENTETVVGT
jgi:hypothetical protein